MTPDEVCFLAQHASNDVVISKSFPLLIAIMYIVKLLLLIDGKASWYGKLLFPPAVTQPTF